MNCFNRGRTKSSRSARRPQCPYLGAVFFLTGHDRDRGEGGVAPTERLAKSVWVGVRLGSSVFDMVLLVNSSSQLGVDIKTRCPLGPFSEHLAGPLVSAGLQQVFVHAHGEGSERNRTNKKGGILPVSLPWARRDRRPIHCTVSSPRFHFLEPSTAEPNTGPDRLGPRRKSPSCAGQVRDRRSGVCVSTVRRGHDGMVESGPDRAVG